MQLRVVYDGFFAAIPGCRIAGVASPGRRLADLVETLGVRHGEKFRKAVLDPQTHDIVAYTSVLVNGRRRELMDPLTEGDEGAFLMPIASLLSHK